MDAVLIVNSALLWVLVLANLLLSLALVRRINSSKLSYESTNPTDITRDRGPIKHGIEVGESAPAFNAHWLSGESVDLSAFRGQSLLLMFTSVECGVCEEALPEYQALYDRAGGAGVQFVLVNISDVDAVKEWQREKHVQMPVLSAPVTRNSMMADFRAPGTPYYTLIDAEGNVVASGFPGPGMTDWKRMVDSWTESLDFGSTAFDSNFQERGFTPA